MPPGESQGNPIIVANITQANLKAHEAQERTASRVLDGALKITPIVGDTPPQAGMGPQRDAIPLPKHPASSFIVYGFIRRLAVFAIAVMGVWPLVLQMILVPQSVFGDGHGDRYEQTSYFAEENDNYQILRPRHVDCTELQRAMTRGVTPTPTQDLIRAVDATSLAAIREFVFNRTTSPSATYLDVNTAILGLDRSRTVCFGGLDGEGSVNVEALLSATEAPNFGLDPTCIADGSTHLRIRLQPTEFYTPSALGDVNPSRIGGAMLLVTPVDGALRPVITKCHEYTRTSRFEATSKQSVYERLVSVFSKQLLVPETCEGFTRFGKRRDTFGCAYAAISASGVVADFLKDGSQRTYSYPAPWRMIQCTVTGECSSLLFTQIWVSEWTVENAPVTEGPPAVLRRNFVNHKVIEVTVDATFTVRAIITMQILVLVITSFLTSASRWYEIKFAKMAPWEDSFRATTSCTIAKTVRSSYNLILAAQLVLGFIEWRKQFTVDMLVGADPKLAILRAAGCGTLAVVLAINVVFARASDLKMQEIEPAFAHVAGLFASVILFVVAVSDHSIGKVRKLLVKGMTTVPTDEVPKYSGCRGSAVCAVNVTLEEYAVIVILVIIGACLLGVAGQTLVQRTARPAGSRWSRPTLASVKTPKRSTRLQVQNSFTRFLDIRFRVLEMYDDSTEVYVDGPGSQDATFLSTRAQLEASGYVAASTMLFRYRDLPLFLAARVLPRRLLSIFNISVTVHELTLAPERVNGLRVFGISDLTLQAHWSKLKEAHLDWTPAYYGSIQETSLARTSSTSSKQGQD